MLSFFFSVSAVSCFSKLTSLEFGPVSFFKPCCDGLDPDLAVKPKVIVCLNLSDGLSQPAGIYPILETWPMWKDSNHKSINTPITITSILYVQNPQLVPSMIITITLYWIFSKSRTEYARQAVLLHFTLTELFFWSMLCFHCQNVLFYLDFAEVC